MSMNSPYGIFDMFDQQSVVKPKPASSLRGGFPRSLPSPYSCHHLIGIVFVPFCILLCQMSLQSFWGVGTMTIPFFCALKASNFTLHKKRPLWRFFQVLMLRLGTKNWRWDSRVPTTNPKQPVVACIRTSIFAGIYSMYLPDSKEICGYSLTILLDIL